MIEQLESLGLSPYEARCYAILLQYGPQKGKALADIAKIPRTSVYPNLEELEKKGFVTLMQKDPKIYSAKKPEVALHAYEQMQSSVLKAKAEAAITAAKNIAAINHELPTDNIELFVGTNQSYNAAKDLGEKTLKELLIVGSGNKTTVLNAMHQWIEAAKRGVQIKIIFESISELKEVIKKLQQNHISVREYKFPNMALIISDRKIVHYAIKSDKLKQGRVVMRVVHEDFAKAQTEFFNALWIKAKK